MEIKRFFVSPDAIDGDRAVITGEEYKHIAIVTRHKVGYRLILCTNDGYDLYCTITSIDKHAVCAHIDEKIKNIAEWESSLTLYQSVCKSEKMDIIVQKAVELGVKRILPFFSAQSGRDINIERLNKIAREAAKQCGRAILVEVEQPIDIAEIDIKFFDRVYFPYEREQIVNYRDVSAFDGKNFALIVGSEGGFTEAEARHFADQGAVSFSLGNRILRAETAVITSISLLSNSLGEMVYKKQ